MKLWSLGQTYTISPTLIWDATFGSNVMDHASQGPDFGTNYGLDVFGIPGTNNAGTTGVGSQGEYADFYSGMPAINTGLAVLGNNAGWTPVTRLEKNYTFSTNVTKVAGKHEIRSGFDFVHLSLDHWQPEINNPRGNFDFGGGITGTPGYSSNAWNSYARVPARPDERLRQERAVRGDDGAREPDGPLRQRSLAGQRQADRQRRPALGVLPADEP